MNTTTTPEEEAVESVSVPEKEVVESVTAPEKEAVESVTAPEKEFAESVTPPENPPTKRVSRIKNRPEAILGLIALLAAVILIVMVVICIPYYSPQQEDPEELARPIHEKIEQALETEYPTEATEPEPDPTENPTIPPEPNPYGRFDFQYNKNNYLLCERQDSYPGIDVSAFQGVIDWEKVKASGIEFAIIRLGYRGYGTGKMVEDEYAKANLKGATEAGLAIGAYFFSQALNLEEVDEEIDFMLNILGDYELDMPIILDWEYISDTARTANMDARTLTDCQLHFCQVMEEKGYQPMVYFNWYQSSHLLYLSELEDYPFWLALYQDRMTYPWRVEMWQYTCTGKVPGINGDVDINVYMPDL